MKSISAGLSAHLDGEVTTLASCWKITRRDGREFYFTDHDQDILFEGKTYEAESSYDRTAIQSNSDFGVDNLDVAGILDSEKITDEELRSGVFNRADVKVFIVNWKNPAQGALKVRRGWFGEVALLGNGTFTTEIRGLAQALSHNFIEVYSAECRADFCDQRCTLNIADFQRRATVTDRGDGRTVFSASALPDAPSVGTSAGAHRYWSIKPTNYPGGSRFFMSEVRFYDQDGNAISGGSAHDNTDDFSKAKVFRDGSFKTLWGFDTQYNDQNDEDDEDYDITKVRWWIDFGSAKDVKLVEIIAGPNAGEAISAFELQYRDDEPDDIGDNWNVAKVCSHLYTQGGESAMWGLGSEGEGPISIADTPQNIPPPYNTVSSYEGGTVEWTTGKNKGRVVEILGYDDATNTISVFEAMPYQIEVGDTFVIAQGCDGSFERCKLYDNIINRRAEDYIPGNDEMVNYPDAI
ncbi:hub [Citromicrobium phage vB_CbaS-RXM]|nr:hub [Citromicrobium phage vB_CbaS-RXM]